MNTPAPPKLGNVIDRCDVRWYEDPEARLYVISLIEGSDQPAKSKKRTRN